MICHSPKAVEFDFNLRSKKWGPEAADLSREAVIILVILESVPMRLACTTACPYPSPGSLGEFLEWVTGWLLHTDWQLSFQGMARQLGLERVTS